MGEISSEERGWKERRREEILVAALEVLEERGYREASMREVAARARASKETLYSWFGSKSGLFEALISWQAERIDAALSRSLEGYG
ncbi:MAG: TetR/AcrR family transcriptional regulator, partial [Rubrobacteraceae bacterium]